MQLLVIRTLASAVLECLHDLPGIKDAQDRTQTICAHSCDLRQRKALSPKPGMKAVFEPTLTMQARANHRPGLHAAGI